MIIITIKSKIWYVGKLIFHKYHMCYAWYILCSVCIYAGQTENDALQEFLAARNPKNEHLLTLESLLIKPIQVNNRIFYKLL